jgi:hypothetical protein
MLLLLLLQLIFGGDLFYFGLEHGQFNIIVLRSHLITILNIKFKSERLISFFLNTN